MSDAGEVVVTPDYHQSVLGLELHARKAGLGMRSQRYSMLVDDGVVKKLNVAAPGKFEVSDADTMLKGL